MGFHELIIQRSDALGGVFDEVRELVAEAECEEGACEDDEAFLPTEFPDEEGDDEYIHRDPYRDVREELPYWVCYRTIPAVDLEGQQLVELMDFLPVNHSLVNGLFVVVAREEDYWSIFYRHFFLE